MKKAWAFVSSGKKVKCTACVRYCRIPSGKTGFCQTRINRDGRLHSLTYGLIQGFQIDPIEKKPLYHFHPGTNVLSFGSYGCNFRCKQCLNSWCSYGEPAGRILRDLPHQNRKSKTVLPREVVAVCRKARCPGIAFTYNEPAIWPEYVYDVACLAKKAGLFTCFVSNGSWTEETLIKLGKVIDAANIDIKGFFPETYRKMGAFYPQIMKNTELALKKHRIHIEVTTLVIPTVNDTKQELAAIARFIRTRLGPDIPWHLTRFDPELAPNREFRQLPCTTKEALEKAVEIGHQAGLNFVYVWAPPKTAAERLYAVTRTTCPGCKKTAIAREAWNVGKIRTDRKGHCLVCGRDLYLVL